LRVAKGERITKRRDKTFTRMQKQQNYEPASKAPFSYGIGNPSGAVTKTSDVQKAQGVVPVTPSIAKTCGDTGAWFNPSDLGWDGAAEAPAPGAGDEASGGAGAWFNPSDLGFEQQPQVVQQPPQTQPQQIQRPPSQAQGAPQAQGQPQGQMPMQRGASQGQGYPPPQQQQGGFPSQQMGQQQGMQQGYPQQQQQFQQQQGSFQQQGGGYPPQQQQQFQQQQQMGYQQQQQQGFPQQGGFPQQQQASFQGNPGFQGQPYPNPQPVVIEQGGVTAIGMSGPVPSQQPQQESDAPAREMDEDYADQHHGPWEVKIKIVEAKDLKFDRKPDPYVRIKTYAETLRTRAVKKTKNPQWNQTLTFPLMDPLGKHWTQGITMEVVHYDADEKHLSLGMAKLCLGDMKHNEPNDLWFFLKNQITKEVVDGQLHIVVVVKGGKKVEEGDEIKKTDQALISHTVTKVTKKVTRKTALGPDGTPLSQDVEVTTSYKGGEKSVPYACTEPGFASTALSPAQPSAMFDQSKGKKPPQQKQKKKKGFAGNQMYSSTFVDAFGEEDEPEGDWSYS